MQVAERSRDEREELGQRGDDRADELPAELLDRRQRRELGDLLAGERRALEDPASQREHVRLSAVVASAFATAAGSPPDSMNAIAVGPSSSTSSASAPASSAARR